MRDLCTNFAVSRVGAETVKHETSIDILSHDKADLEGSRPLDVYRNVHTSTSASTQARRR